MKQAGELEVLLSQTLSKTVVATNNPEFYLNISYPEPIKFKINRHCFSTVKLLLSVLDELNQEKKMLGGLIMS